MTNATHNTSRVPEERLIRLQEILKLLPIGRTTFYRWIKEEKAPPPIKAGARISLWRRSEIEAMVRGWEDGGNRTDDKTEQKANIKNASQAGF